jgi:hypothetical protein
MVTTARMNPGFSTFDSEKHFTLKKLVATNHDIHRTIQNIPD